MISLNSPIWKELSSAGRDTDKWLRYLMEQKGDFHENMMFLAEDLSHQFCFYNATAYVLPYLAALCPKLSQEDKVYLITQIGPAIAAEGAAPLLLDTEAYREFEEGLRGLRRETKNLVTDPAIAAILGNDLWQDQEFVLSVLAILGDRMHAFGIYRVFSSKHKEGDAACSCGFETTELSFEDDLDYFDIQPISIPPWDGKTMDNEPVWFQGLLNLIGDEENIRVLPWIYGTCTCPDCKKQEPYWDWLAHAVFKIE